MTKVCVGVNKDKGRDSSVYVDTDDLDQLAYYYYFKAKKLKLNSSAKTLLGQFTADMIENKEK